MKKTLLSELKELFSVYQMEEAESGKKVYLRNEENGEEIVFFEEGELEQGFGYKNKEAYNRDVYEVCYISEYAYKDYETYLGCTLNEYKKNKITFKELSSKINDLTNSSGYSHKDFLAITNYQEEISSHLFDSVDWQYPDILFDEWKNTNEINKIGNKYIFTAGMELNDFLKMEYLKNFQQDNVNVVQINGKEYINIEDLVNFNIRKFSKKAEM